MALCTLLSYLILAPNAGSDVTKRTEVCPLVSPLFLRFYTPLSVEAHSRPTYRAALSQPSQMGNFKHQSMRSNDRDREHPDKDRDRDMRDKDGQERLRHVLSSLPSYRSGLTSFRSPTNMIVTVLICPPRLQCEVQSRGRLRASHISRQALQADLLAPLDHPILRLRENRIRETQGKGNSAKEKIGDEVSLLPITA